MILYASVYQSEITTIVRWLYYAMVKPNNRPSKLERQRSYFAKIKVGL